MEDAIYCVDCVCINLGQIRPERRANGRWAFHAGCINARLREIWGKGKTGNASTVRCDHAVPGAP